MQIDISIIDKYLEYKKMINMRENETTIKPFKYKAKSWVETDNDTRET